MNSRRIWRILLLILAVILLAVPIITPLIELSGAHNHTCSSARCLLCTVSDTLKAAADLSALLIRVLLPYVILITLGTDAASRLYLRTETPIALKTKMLS